MADRRLPGDKLAGELAGAVLRQMDLDGVISRIDLQQALERVDFDRVLADVDIDALLEQVDLDAVVQRIDVERLVERIDLEALLERIDLDVVVSMAIERAVETGSLQWAFDRVDLGPALERAGLAEIVAGSVGQTSLDTVRRRVVVLDALVARLTGAILRQSIDEWPAGPQQLVGDEKGPLGDIDAELGGNEAWDLSGHYAGPFARVLCTVGDVVGAVASYTFATTTLVSLLASVFGQDAIGGSTQGLAWAIGLAVWIGAWFLLPLELVGRTPAMSLLGLRVVASDGSAPRFGQLLMRSVAQLPSVLLLGIGYVLMLFDKQRRTAHDMVGGTAVVWDWGDRGATVASPLGHWVARQPTVPKKDDRSGGSTDDGPSDHGSSETVSARPRAPRRDD